MADRRTLRYAILASLALHLSLLIPLPPAPPRPDGRQAPLTARLMDPVKAERTTESPRPRIAKTVPRPTPKAEQPAIEVPEAVSRDQYRIALMAEALRQARERHPPQGYPQAARESQWEGDVQVGLLISAGGGATLTLKSGSGYEILDEQALEFLRSAAQAIAPPPALRGKDFAIEVRATYRLGD